MTFKKYNLQDRGKAKLDENISPSDTSFSIREYENLPESNFTLTIEQYQDGELVKSERIYVASRSDNVLSGVERGYAGSTAKDFNEGDDLKLNIIAEHITDIQNEVERLEQDKANLSGGNTFDGNQTFNNKIYLKGGSKTDYDRWNTITNQDGSEAGSFGAYTWGGYFTLRDNTGNIKVYARGDGKVGINKNPERELDIIGNIRSYINGDNLQTIASKDGGTSGIFMTEDYLNNKYGFEVVYGGTSNLLFVNRRNDSTTGINVYTIDRGNGKMIYNGVSSSIPTIEIKNTGTGDADAIFRLSSNDTGESEMQFYNSGNKIGLLGTGGYFANRMSLINVGTGTEDYIDLLTGGTDTGKRKLRARNGSLNTIEITSGASNDHFNNNKAGMLNNTFTMGISGSSFYIYFKDSSGNYHRYILKSDNTINYSTM